MEFARIKKRAALLSVSSNTFLILSKLIVGIFTGSVSIISEAIHSMTDLIAAILAFYSVRASSEPADTEHQFGHGKFEDLSGLIEGALILLAALFIIHEAYGKITNGMEEHIATTAGIAVMLISVMVNILISSHLFKTAHKTESIALLADAEHLRTDVYTSAGVLLGLVAIRFTGISILDPIIAIFVAIFIIKAGWDLCWKAGKNLLDTSLPEEERIVIKNIVNKYIPEQAVDILNLKTRKAGADRLIEFTLIVPESLTIKEGHALCDSVEDDLSKDLGNVNITIHLEPCSKICKECSLFHKDALACKQLKDKSR